MLHLHDGNKLVMFNSTFTLSFFCKKVKDECSKLAGLEEVVG